MRKPYRAIASAALTGVCVLAAALMPCAPVQAQAPADFAWRATLDTPAQAGLVRAALPADALMRLRSSQAADVRIFDAAGQPVPFAFAAPVDAPPPARDATPAYPARALFSARAGTRVPPSGIQVQVKDGVQGQSVWVQTGAANLAVPAGATRLPSALFDTRKSTQTISGLVVKAQLPANAPIAMTLATSRDLAQWTDVPLSGSVYRFDGTGAPGNDTLELEQPLKLDGLYLRLGWEGQDGVIMESVSGLVAAAVRAAPQVSAVLPQPRRDGAGAIEWDLGFAVPPTALALSVAQPNTFVPVRVLGRDTASGAWRPLGQGAVYRLNGGASESVNAAIPLQPTAVRALRVEATHGMRLEGVPLTASVVFAPVELIFVAGGKGPYQLAAGRAGTAPAAVPLAMIAAAIGGRIDGLPAARISGVTAQPDAPPSALSRLLPAGVDDKAAMLWGVLLLAVAVLGGVAWSLLKQLKGGKQDVA